MPSNIAIMIPCYNEGLTIKKVIQSFQEILSNTDFLFTIYVYDNNSNDNTSEIVQSILTDNIVYRKESQQGKGHVVRRMFREIDADCYILVDGDDTYYAEDVLQMINGIVNEKYDMIIGNRLSKNYFKENKRIFHSFGNRLVSKLINTLFKSNIIDIMTGYRAFSKKYVKTAGVLAQGFELETEITILALDGFYKIKEIPVNYKDRIFGSTSKLNTYSDGSLVLKTIFTLFKDYKPFEFFSILFYLLLTISITLFIPILLEYYKTGLVLRFPTLFVSIFFAILAIFSILIGTVLSSIVKFQKRQREIVIINYERSCDR